MTFLQRIGLVLVAPRRAVRQIVAGRGAADVGWLLAARVLAGETPRVVRALVRGGEGNLQSAVMGVIGASSAVLPDLLGILIGAILLAFFGGRHKPDRTLDAASYAWVPYLAVQLCGAIVWTALGRPMSTFEEVAVDLISLGWASAIWVLALVELRHSAAGGELRQSAASGPAASSGAARAAGAFVALGLTTMLALNIVWIARHKDSLGGTKTGRPAPELSLPLLDGNGRVQLSAWRGREVVLSFWATWCGPCVGELPDVQRLADERKEVQFVAVNVDEPGSDQKVRAFRDKLGLRMPILLDDGSASQSYRVDTIPRFIVIDAQGNVVRSLDGAHSLDEMRRAVESAH